MIAPYEGSLCCTRRDLALWFRALRCAGGEIGDAAEVRLKIVLLSEQYPPIVWDGIGTYMGNLARALAANGHEVHALCVKGFRVADEMDAGVHVHRRPPLRLPLAKLPGPLGRRFIPQRDSLGLRWTLATSYAFWLKVLDLKPDVIETGEGETRALVTALRHDVPLVIQLHTPTMLDLRLRYQQLSLKGRLVDALDRYSANHADALSCTAEMLVERLREDAWLSRERPVSIIPVPFDATPFEEVHSADRTAPIVLGVGRLEWRKAPDTLLEAVGVLVQRGIDVELVLPGNSAGEIEGQPWDRWLAQRAAALGVRLRLVGLVDTAALRELYREARVVAVPSRFDSFPTVALEAMASGRPVVASSATGVVRLIEESAAGAVVPPDDPVALADALAPFVIDRDHAAAVGARGRAGVRALEPRAIARQREELYRRAIESHRARRAGAGVQTTS